MSKGLIRAVLALCWLLLAVSLAFGDTRETTATASQSVGSAGALHNDAESLGRFSREQWELNEAETVKSVTFLFEDGTIRTVSADNSPGGMAGSGGASLGNPGTGTAAGGVAGKGLGWISDRRGIPCVTGSRISNAVDYLSGRMLARGIETAGQAFARAQTTVNTTPLGGYTSAVTGNVMNYALGQTAAGGADELAKWIADRQSQMFDVVYVDTGAEVAVHIDHEITIDYEPQGRRLYRARETASHPVVGGLD